MKKNEKTGKMLPDEALDRVLGGIGIIPDPEPDLSGTQGPLRSRQELINSGACLPKQETGGGMSSQQDSSGASAVTRQAWTAYSCSDPQNKGKKSACQGCAAFR